MPVTLPRAVSALPEMVPALVSEELVSAYMPIKLSAVSLPVNSIEMVPVLPASE